MISIRHCLAFLACSVLAHSVLASETDTKILEQIHSPYNGELAVVDFKGTRYLVAQAIRGVVLQSSMDLKHHTSIATDYLKIMALMTSLHPKPAHIFSLGLGGSELPRFQLQKCPECWIDTAEIDPTVIQIAKKYFDTENSHHNIIDGDGFATLKAQSKKYDVIWVDTVLPKDGPRAYINALDLKTLNGHLNDQGIVVVNMGVTKTATLFSETEKGFKRNFSNGIRVKMPTQDFSETLKNLQPIISGKPDPSVHSLLPTYLIAIGNLPNLNCKNFWALYQSWHKDKVLSLKWDKNTTDPALDYCQDLP